MPDHSNLFRAVDCSYVVGVFWPDIENAPQIQDYNPNGTMGLAWVVDGVCGTQLPLSCGNPPGTSIISHSASEVVLGESGFQHGGGKAKCEGCSGKGTAAKGQGTAAVGSYGKAAGGKVTTAGGKGAAAKDGPYNSHGGRVDEDGDEDAGDDSLREADETGALAEMPSLTASTIAQIQRLEAQERRSQWCNLQAANGPSNAAEPSDMPNFAESFA